MSGKVTLKKVREEEVADRPLAGLKDGGHVYLSCSNCRAMLVDLFVTRPREPQTWKCQATCPWCPPDKAGRPETSFVVDVKGGFHVAGIAVAKVDEPDEDRARSTVVHQSDIQSDRFLFTVNKAHEHAKPVFRL
jgi:hypothetical protein